MAILMKIVFGIGLALLFVASICVTIVALFPPKEYTGESKENKES